MVQDYIREATGGGSNPLPARHCLQILNGASVIFSPFFGVELTSWKARTQPQVTAVFDPFETFAQ